MKKAISVILVLMMVLSLTACGGNSNDTAKEAPDLTRYYEDFLSGLGADGAPAMMDMNEDAGLVESFFPGLGDIELKQNILQTAAIGAVAFEFDLVEVANADDAAKVQEIFQARVDSQINGGAFYPATVEAWENAKVITNGNVVALIVAGEQQAAAEEAFNALFA